MTKVTTTTVSITSGKQSTNNVWTVATSIPAANTTKLTDSKYTTTRTTTATATTKSLSSKSTAAKSTTTTSRI